MKHLVFGILILLLLAWALPACSTPRPDLPIIPPVLSTLQAENDPLSGQTYSSEGQFGSSASLSTFWVRPELPARLQQSLSIPAVFAVETDRERALLRLDVGQENVYSRWVYALVAPFPTIPDGVTWEHLQNTWNGRPAGPFAGQPILMEDATLDLFEQWWGSPAEGAVETVGPSLLLDKAWEQRPSWALIPFEQVTPRWKVLEVDGRSPLRKDFDPQAYPLSLPISLFSEDPQRLAEANASFGPGSPQPLITPVNRDPNLLSTLVMTGVTAMARATAWEMETKGINFPAEYIGELLATADITHISNEVPFFDRCPIPDPNQTKMVFCSDPKYIELLVHVGTDVIELTGDHFGDWGTEAMEYTLQLYDQLGWPFYGGGYTAEQAKQAVFLEHNGNRLAFIGCNGKGGGYATASETEPGAVECDYEWLAEEIRRLSAEGYLVIMTFQHLEYYNYKPQILQKQDFRPMAEAGAVIVSGSQAHQAQGIEFLDDGVIYYGLGNLFFDQLTVSDDTARALILRHVFYDGRYIGAEIFTIIFETYSQARFMTPEERSDLLEKVFAGSGW